jgi:hypothetical protein
MPTTERLRAALADRYAVEREIGSGGMATVYLARDLKHEREVALKVLRADLSAVIGGERFLSEVRITAKLDHPHILTLIDSGSADGILYYVLPYVRGESLRARIDREKQLGIDEALSITKQVASALDYAHRQGVVHRDIKPENILFHEGEAVLADFGIALAVKEAGGNRLTETGLSLGTPQYMSPEQATGNRALDARSDIYSLGAVLYEMLAGEPPVTGATAHAMIAKLLTERPPSVRVVRDTVPIAIDAAVTKALAKVPADRFASARDFVNALGVASPAPAATATRRVPRWSYGVAAVAVVAVGGWLLAAGLRRPPSPIALADRKQITFSGRVRNPWVSRDGTQLAYAVTNCGSKGCTYGIDLQDVGGTATRRLFDGATALYDAEWSPDRRNILFEGSINGVYGQYLISTLGGAPRRVNPFVATFWGNDSLLFIKSPYPNPDYWIYVGGLDAVPRDSMRIAGIGHSLQGIVAMPGSKWIVVRFEDNEKNVWLALDRSGRVHHRLVTPLVQNMSSSSDALWLRSGFGASSQQPVVGRIAFDVNDGHFASRIDTLYRLGAEDDFSVTGDGSTLVFGEGVAEFDVLVGDFHEQMNGGLARDRSVLHSTVAPRVFMSTDGGRLLIGRVDGSSNGEWRWNVTSASGGGGPESTISGGGVGSVGFFTDSNTIEMRERGPEGWRLSLIDVRTNARRAVFTVPDSTVDDFSALPGGGWAWLSPDGRSIAVRPAGAAATRRIPLSPWYLRALAMSASIDGGKLAVVGWSAPSGDSIGLSVLSVSDGSESHWSTVFGEGANVLWLTDGSVMLYNQATNDTYTLQRIRGPGQIEQLGAIPRPIVGVSVSRDLRRMSIVARDRHGDAWSMRVVKR